MNEAIGATHVHLIGDDGSDLGTVATSEALKLARAGGFDLVEIAVESPPLCRLMHFDAWKAQQDHRRRRRR